MPEYGKIKYLHMFLYGEDLHQLKIFWGNILHTTNANFNQIILGIGTYLFPVSDQNRVIYHRIINTCTLNFRRYAERLTQLNDCLVVFTGYN